MDELLSSITQYLAANSGKVTYKALYDNTAPEQRAMLPRALNQLKANGTLKKNLVWDAAAKENTLFIERVG